MAIWHKSTNSKYNIRINLKLLLFKKFGKVLTENMKFRINKLKYRKKLKE
jgi:hypothetical protein